ncbi:MAG: rod shape-determining protein MreD [Chitinivibrionia bacterium]|nr:rod shape-determining protein MreD [Chitinivibrionia bacterium]
MSAIKEIIKWILLFLLVLVIQTTVIPKIAIFGIFPDLPLILLFIFSINYGGTKGIWCGFSLGLLIDVFSAGLLGANALAKTVVGAVAGIFDRKNMAIDPILQLIMLLITVIIHDTVIYLSDAAVGGANPFAELPMFLLVSALPRAVYTTIFAVIAFMLSDFLFHSKSKR